MDFATTMRERFKGPEHLRSALEDVLGTITGLKKTRAEIAARKDLSAVGQAALLKAYIQGTTNRNLQDFRGRLERDKAQIAKRRAEITKVAKPTSDVEFLEQREIRDWLNTLSVGETADALLQGEKAIAAAALNSPVPMKTFTPEIRARVERRLFGDQLDALSQDEEGIVIVEGAIKMAEYEAEKAAQEAARAA